MSTELGGREVPAFPELPAELVDAYAHADDAVQVRLEAVGPLARRLFSFVQRRITIEALANVAPTRPNADRSVLFPERRRFLSAREAARLRGCAVAFRHVDARLAMWRAGQVNDLVGQETPMVLNALGESSDPDARETNPGLLRATESGFDETNSSFVPALPSQCAQLISTAVEVAVRLPAPAIARAGWLATVVFAVHPFVDGNGRTARLLFFLVSSSGAASGVDWGSMEQWAATRTAYMIALRRCTDPSAPAYRGDLVETLPFMTYATERATTGALVTAERLGAVERLLDQVPDVESDEHRLVAAAIAIDRNAVLAELVELVDEPALTVIVNDLVMSRTVQWDGRTTLNATW